MDGDLRKEISRLVAQKGWTLLELRRDSKSLEAVFRDLTRGDERLDRGDAWAEAHAPSDEEDDEAGEEEEDEPPTAKAKPKAEEEEDDEEDEDDEDEEDDEDDEDEDEEDEEPKEKGKV
jgi:hypothetical protein